MQELKTFKYTFSTENIALETFLNSSESSKGSLPKSNDVKISGDLKNVIISCYEKANCAVFYINLLVFHTNNHSLEYDCKKLRAKVIKKGSKSDAESFTIEKLHGLVTLVNPLQIKLTSDPVLLDLSIEDMNLIVLSINELKSFYFRITNPSNKDFENLASEILFIEQKVNRNNEDSLIETLKKHSAYLALELEKKINECNLLRKSLSHVAGNSGIAGILNIETSSIIIVSEKAQIEGTDVNLVLTQEFLYVLTKEGRILNRNLVCEMTALEEKGNNELCIRMKEGKNIRACLMNKNQFVNAVKSIFQIENN